MAPSFRSLILPSSADCETAARLYAALSQDARARVAWWLAAQAAGHFPWVEAEFDTETVFYTLSFDDPADGALAQQFFAAVHGSHARSPDEGQC